MKWALVLALVLCCGLAKGETENDSIESLDKLTDQLAQEFLISARNSEDQTQCTKICEDSEECYFDDKKEEQCRCVEKFAKKDGVCVECTKACPESEECYFDDKKEEQCRCVEKFAKKDDVCVACECSKENEECYFDDGGEAQCRCIKKFSRKGGECVACNADCNENEECYFDEEDKEECRCVEKFEKDGDTCKPCDCGTNGTCSFDGSSQPVCACNPQYELKNGKCAYCNCGGKGKCSFDGDNKVCSCDEGYAEDTTGECKACDCGETTSTGCEFTGGEKICKCKDKNSQKVNQCEVCYCGEKGNCSFNGENKVCSCEEGYSDDKDKTGECKECYCGDKTKANSCAFNKEGEKVCDCVSMNADKNGTCTACDCGTNGTSCSFDDKGLQVCECKEKNAVKNGKCEFCYCGEKGNCSFNGDNKVCLCEEGYAEDKDAGECKECDCGSNGECSFENKNKTCSCNKGYKEKGGQCIACDCKGNGTCSFNETGAITCECDQGFANKKDGLCHPCDCKGDGTCKFDETDALTCDCNQGFAKMKDGLCHPCDCGEHGTCSLDDSGKKTCDCKSKFAEKNGTCVDCECGAEAKSCQFNNDVKTCYCNSKYADKDGTCSECNCGEINKEAKSCKFNKGVKECECVSLYAPKDGTCTDCSCGNTTVVEGCEFKDDEKVCKCKKTFYQKDESCEVCNCGENGKCSFINEEKQCKCDDGYKEDEGICKICDCGKNGECLFKDHVKTCNCNFLYEDNNGKCEVCDCGEKGECSFVNQKKNCTCEDGYLEYNGTCTAPCKTNDDCKHKTTCKETKTKGVSFCDCKKTFTGHFCEMVVDCEFEGKLHKCQFTGGECSYNFTQNKAVCECNEEKKFDEDLNICRDKCKTDETCKNGGKCQDELCVCPTGTSNDDCSRVDGCDRDFREKCETISAKCVYDNTTNNATCQCNNNDLEYKDDKCIAKWCDSNPCKAKNSVCVYGFKSGFCKCTESGKYYDYATNNCIDIDKCLSVSCKDNEYCTDGKCECDKNHVKENDECKRKNFCDSNPCSLNATCIEGKAIGTAKCECSSDKYFNTKSKNCEVMIKEEEKCKDKDCGPFGYCVKKGDTTECDCKTDMAVLNKTTGVCILKGKTACLSKKVLSDNPQKCNCSGMYKDSTNGITCEYITCGDEAAQKDCESKGAYCVDAVNKEKQKTYACACSAGQTLTTDKGCVDACSDKAVECFKNQQTCYLDENGSASCKCPPGFTETKTDGKTTCKLNVQFSYLLKELPVMKEEFLNKDQSVNKLKLNQYVIKSMKALSSKSYEFASVQSFRISDYAILCDVWLNFKEDAEQDVKRWRSQVVSLNDSIVLPPSLKLSSVELSKVTYEKLEFCSPLVYQTVCGRQGSKCEKNACSCMDGFDVVGPTVQVIEGNTIMRCEDIDECRENKHSCNSANSECMDILGGHYCKCLPGFHKKDKNESEECVELCSPNPCTNGDCTVNEKENRVECSCTAGFKGSYCTESDDKLKQAQHSTKVVGAVLGTILAVTFVAIIAYVVKLKKNSYSEDFSTSPRDNSEMAERPLRGISNRGYQ